MLKILATLLLAWSHAAPPARIALLSEADDLRRANTKTPGVQYLASSGATLAHTLNAHLHAEAELDTRPCHEFSLDELEDLAKTMISMRHTSLDEIYNSSSDSRALRARDSASLESLWAQGKHLAGQKPVYLNMVRAGKCADLVMMFVHHLAGEQGVEHLGRQQHTTHARAHTHIQKAADKNSSS